MSRRQVSAAVIVSAAGAIVLLAYLFWMYLAAAGTLWIAVRILMRRHGIGTVKRHRKGILELAAAAVAALWAERKLRPELEARARTQHARADELEARAALARAKAEDAEAILIESRRRADRAKGVTRSEIAQLQSGALMKGHL